MTNLESRDFSNFYLGDNVYELAGGVIPEIAEHLGVELGDRPDSTSLGNLVGAIGANKVLRNNEGVTAIDLSTAADLLAQSGVQNELDRSLWVPEQATDMTTRVITGAVANWQDRATNLLVSDARNGADGVVHVVTGNREMKSPTEVTNANVVAFVEKYGVLPNESQYAEEVVLKRLEKVGYSVNLSAHDTDDGNRIAEEFAKNHAAIWDGTVQVARVANAGIQLATQMRQAARAVNPQFDADSSAPQLFIRTDSYPIARSLEEIVNPKVYQSPFTGLRQAAVTAKTLHEASL